MSSTTGIKRATLRDQVRTCAPLHEASLVRDCLPPLPGCPDQFQRARRHDRPKRGPVALPFFRRVVESRVQRVFDRCPKDRKLVTPIGRNQLRQRFEYLKVFVSLRDDAKPGPRREIVGFLLGHAAKILPFISEPVSDRSGKTDECVRNSSLPRAWVQQVYRCRESARRRS